MSLIPFVENPNPTVVDSTEKFVEQGGENGEAILITPLDRIQLTDPNHTNATYDLRVGQRYGDHRNRGGNDLPSDGGIRLPPGTAVMIETEEWVRLPRTRLGYLIPKVSLLQAGVSNTSSKVDPGYNGHLIVTVFNLGKKMVTLSRLQPFCALCVHRVEGTPKLYAGGGKQLQGKAQAGRWNALRDWLDRNSATLLILLLLATLIQIIVSISSALR